MENNVNYQEMYDRFDAIEKKHQEIKKMLSETNILVDSLKADSVRMLREKQGVSDEEFREAYEFWKDNNSNICTEIWGKGVLSEILFCTSLSNFVNKYKEYKNKQNEIRVRDEVEFDDTLNNLHRAMVVTSIRNEYCYDGICKDGNVYTVEKGALYKTGKHYDSIDEFMNS